MSPPPLGQRPKLKLTSPPGFFPPTGTGPTQMQQHNAEGNDHLNTTIPMPMSAITAQHTTTLQTDLHLWWASVQWHSGLIHPLPTHTSRPPSHIKRSSDSIVPRGTISGGVGGFKRSGHHLGSITLFMSRNKSPFSVGFLCCTLSMQGVLVHGRRLGTRPFVRVVVCHRTCSGGVRTQAKPFFSGVQKTTEHNFR